MLFNASPDILEQIRSNPTLQPGRALRDTAIAGVVLIDGQIDHSTGLFMLRERGSPLAAVVHRPGRRRPDAPATRCCACSATSAAWTASASAWTARAFEVPGVARLSFRAFPLSSKAAPYSPHREAPVPGDNIGMLITDRRSGRSAFYAPGLGEITPALFDVMCGADAVLVDGTFWTDDEMIRLGLSKKTARDIGHLPQSGAGGMIEWLDKLPATTRRAAHPHQQHQPDPRRRLDRSAPLWRSTASRSARTA